MSIDRNIVIKLHKKFFKIIISMSIDHEIVIKLHNSRESNSEIAKLLKMNCTTVWKIIKKFQEIGTTLDWEGKGENGLFIPGRSCDATLTEVAGTWLLQLV